MRRVLAGAALAFGCFSKIPMVQVEWNEANMRWMMCFFPVVGVVIGLVLLAWTWLCQALGFGQLLFGAGLALVPVALTGGIHLDGLADVADAQSSHLDPARKREILKDPHVGAFAIIAVAVYLIAYTALSGELACSWGSVLLVGGMHVLSRCASGLASTLLPGSSDAGMLASFRRSGVRVAVPVVLCVELAACAVGMLILNVYAALAMLAVLAVLAALLNPFAKSQFGGMSGDVAGCFLQAAELAMLCALVVSTKVVGL